MSAKPTKKTKVRAFYDAATGSVGYVVHAGPGSSCAIIDPVLDFDVRSGTTTTMFADRIINYVRILDLRCVWILETHAHADHLSAARYLKNILGGQIGIGAHIAQVERAFSKIFPVSTSNFLRTSWFDHYFSENERFHIGNLSVTALHVPGHTPADVAYLIDDAVFVGDTLFMPDVGTARCDFPGGSASRLYASIQQLLALPGKTRMFICHDYPPEGRAPAWETSVEKQRQFNIHVCNGTSEQTFVELRNRRDATLVWPALLLPSIQVNLRAGNLPDPQSNGVRYLQIPLDSLGEIYPCPPKDLLH